MSDLVERNNEFDRSIVRRLIELRAVLSLLGNRRYLNKLRAVRSLLGEL